MNKINLKRTLVTTLVLLMSMLFFYITAAFALNVETGCGRNDIQSAVDQVADAGVGTVNIKAGDCSWGDVQPVYVTGNVNLIGAGKDSTTIRLTNRHYNGVIYYNSGDTYTPTDFARISGINFVANVNTKIISFRQTTAFRVDHCQFEGNGQINSPIGWKSGSKGLIDNNTFINPNDPVAGSYAGVSAGTTYAGGLPSTGSASTCDKAPSSGGACTCWVGDKDAGERSGNSSVSSGMTVIQPNPAVIDNENGSGQGTVRRIYLQIESVGANPTVTVASFSRSGNTFTARGRAVNLPVAVGKNIYLAEDNDFTPFPIHDGDYLGVYLNDCVLDASSGSSGWTVSGDQTGGGADFGSPDIGNVPLAAELFDNEGDFQACEETWDRYYDDVSNQRVAYDEFIETMDPASGNAVYLEDNTWDWYKTALIGNWGNGQRFVVRHNTFRHDTSMVFTGFKPGTSYAIIHDNTFEETSGGTGGYAIRIRTNGLIFNNNFVNLTISVVSNGFRAYGDHYFPPQARTKELYIFDNNYSNSSCGSTDEDCFGGFNSCSTCALVGVGENGNIHLRAPASGERLYNFQDNMFAYPHPWRANDPISPSPPANLQINRP